MDFALTPEQALLRDSVDRFVADRCGALPIHRAPGALWTGIAELGLLGLPFAENEGGIGAGPVETMLVMEAFGRGLVTEPYLASTVLCGAVLRHGASRAQRAALVPSLADGTLSLALAQAEAGSRHDLQDVSTTARRDGEGWTLDGAKTAVLNGAEAGLLLVSARSAGARRERDGVSLFLLDSAASGVTRHGAGTQDGMRAADIILDGVHVADTDRIGPAGGALPILEHAVDVALGALCAEAVGAMQAALDSTLLHLRTREQFGVPIGSFQALQHRAADMLVALEQARSMAIYAATMAEEPDAVIRRPAIAAAKVQVDASARRIGEDAVQLHGGIALTQEFRLGHLYKRLTMIGAMFGDADHHLRIVADGFGLIGPD